LAVRRISSAPRRSVLPDRRRARALGHRHAGSLATGAARGESVAGAGDPHGVTKRPHSPIATDSRDEASNGMTLPVSHELRASLANHTVLVIDDNEAVCT